MKIRIKDINEKYGMEITELLALVYVFSLDLRYLTNINLYFTSFIWGVVGLLTFLYIYNNFINVRKVLKELIFIDFFAFIGMIVNGNQNIGNIVILFSAEIFGVLIYLVKDNLKKIDIAIFITLFIVIIRTIFAMFENKSMFFEKYMFSKIMGSNTLFIFVIFLLFVDILYIQKKNRCLLYLLIFFFSIFSNGNGNILSFFLLNMSLLFINETGDEILWKRVIIISAIGVFTAVVSGYITNIIYFLTDDHDRVWMWKQYFFYAFTDLKSFIFGADISVDESLPLYRHMHNSYISWHCFYGLIPTLGFAIIVIRDVLYTIQCRQFLNMIFLLITIIRGFTDEATFLFLPIWVFFMCMYTLNKNSNQSIRYVDEKGLDS